MSLIMAEIHVFNKEFFLIETRMGRVGILLTAKDSLSIIPWIAPLPPPMLYFDRYIKGSVNP